MEITFGEIKGFEHVIELTKQFRKKQFTFCFHNKKIYKLIKNSKIDISKAYLLNFHDLDELEFDVCLLTHTGEVFYFNNESDTPLSASINEYDINNTAFEFSLVNNRYLFLFNKEFPNVLEKKVLSVVEKTYSKEEFQMLLSLTNRTQEHLLAELSTSPQRLSVSYLFNQLIKHLIKK